MEPLIEYVSRKIVALILSRRFWVAMAGVVVLVSRELLGWELDPTTVVSFIGLLISWIIGDSLHNTQIPRP